MGSNVCANYPPLSSTPYTGSLGPPDDYVTLDDLPPEMPNDSSTTTTTTNGDSQERLYKGFNDKLIPIYCSILAAVVGLVAFIIFKM
ncbi:hypothetical protein ATANTOWER_007845 [Ataeniobius toweri]|uniref:Tumor necrosis factor receptor member 16 transmembrane domain-containing protein n=1 Tax=Ataeniobius toweri TaxID=208326 RepID=A0ABU7AXN9_9TELE|nr:hypothetical protein [Ataeniobius toweri]